MRNNYTQYQYKSGWSNAGMNNSDDYNGYKRIGNKYKNNNSNQNKIGQNLKPIDWKNIKLEPFERNLYNEHSDISKLTKDEVEEIRKKHDITILEGSENALNPVESIYKVGFPNCIIKTLEKNNIVTPTPIQIQGWPIALSGKDMIGKAETGSGKTLAFLLPAFVHILAQPALRYGDGPISLVMTPTRELAEQIKQECIKFSAYSHIKTTCVYGGVPKNSQIYALKNGVHILIACPGRLIDLLQMNILNLMRVTYFVLDEADKMLDMGFEYQILKINSQIRPDRQTLLWSATWPQEVESLAKCICNKDAIRINVGSLTLTACRNVKQEIMFMEENEKIGNLNSLLRRIFKTDERIIVFVQTKRTADYITTALRLEGKPALSIHGDKKQAEREWVLNDFKIGKNPILIATDVASRGLDIKNVKYVINFDFPNQIEDYVHRIGRTGRAGNHGASFTFMTPTKNKVINHLINILKESGQPIPPQLRQLTCAPSISKRASPYSTNRVGGFGNSKYGKMDRRGMNMRHF